MRQLANRHRHKRGEALVEGALVLLALISLILGIVDFGRILLLQQTFHQRVSAGARYASIHGVDTAAIANVIVFNSPTAPSGKTTGMLGLSPSNISVARLNAGDRTQDRIQVRIVNFPMTFMLPFLRKTIRPTFTAVRPVEAMGATN